MPDLQDGETAEVQGSAARPYIIKNVGGVFSCSCPAWKNQSLPIERRTCKHIRRYRSEEAEAARLGQIQPTPPAAADKQKSSPPKLLLAETWTGDTDPTGWFLSEKLDGARALWNA